MGGRVVSAFFMVMVVMSLMILRLYSITTGDGLAQAAARQSTYTLTAVRRRGMIYDCNFTPLVNQGWGYVAAVTPEAASARALLERVELPDAERRKVLSQLAGGKPFTLQVPDPRIYENGIRVYEAPIRYGGRTLAPHILGTVDAGGLGRSGIELGFDELLVAHTATISARFTVNALGQVMAERGIETVLSGQDDHTGVVLTLDRTTQMLCENVMKLRSEKGACIVMDAQTGKLRAVVSTPLFDPEDVAGALDDADAPLINRAFSAYSVGSTFKLAVAAAALENGIGADYTYFCEGQITIGDTTYHCHNRDGHGYVDMRRAVEVSCNPYFINLLMQTGYTSVYSMASLMGFGTAARITDGISSAAGNLPAPNAVVSRGEMANLAFGQGKLLATPLQIAQMLSTIVGGGETIPPILVEGISDESGRAIAQIPPTYSGSRVMRQSTADTLASWLVSAVERGSGRNAAPRLYTAGGKTGTAQTGRFDADGEALHAWFAGFYPADEPQVIVVVLIEDGGEGSYVAAPVFREICNGLAELGRI